MKDRWETCSPESIGVKIIALDTILFELRKKSCKRPPKNLLDPPKYEDRKNFQKILLGCGLVLICTLAIV